MTWHNYILYWLSSQNQHSNTIQVTVYHIASSATQSNSVYISMRHNSMEYSESASNLLCHSSGPVLLIYIYIMAML